MLRNLCGANGCPRLGMYGNIGIFVDVRLFVICFSR